MTKRIRRLVVGLTLTAAAGTTLSATSSVADTHWGAGSTSEVLADTHWGINPPEGEDGQEDGEGEAPVVPQDTHWG
ncbi:hypothetical protein [Streptomyces sp. DHE17-7]|uniref:hypothetical protein n=1 Tax=Streptomyces sp. DHE17-7 TaxID=2759949 RepID=UPI000EF04D2B|nr:hypothetical protein [Streptomyces sp. DHE17-7]MBJ6623525.1 hypothetical protein [Streptomyces sp. DHE17-7]RIH58162.1 hypothetical protein D3C59_36920 [Streptomyces sp. SHP22-7]RIH58461.1 hypothetical protein D3C59_35045 [Streptomyces sp. SHP22-7]